MRKAKVETSLPGMDNQTQPTQPQPQADRPVAQIQTTPPVQPIKKSNTLLILVVFVLTLIIIGLLGYILLTGQTEKLQTTTLPTPTELPMPTTNIIPSTSPVVSPSPAATVTLTVKPTIIPNPDGNTFTSNKMGVAFYYANKAPADSTGSVKVLESGSTVYVYISSGKPENGQFIERFDKSPTDTLAQAISKKFLAGISPADCYVKIDPKKPSPTITRATIGYPVPTGSTEPSFTFGAKCPEKYKESNGMAFFMEDSKSPDRFYWVSIGQYGIPAYNTKEEPMWQDTIVVF